MHRDESYQIDNADVVPGEWWPPASNRGKPPCATARSTAYATSQATVLAPTGCLVGGSLVTTDRGLVRLRSLGDPDGAQWQDSAFDVLTDDGVQQARSSTSTGSSRSSTCDTSRGYRIQGTTKHRIKVVDADGGWVWRRFADLRSGDRVPLALGQLIGTPNEVALCLRCRRRWRGPASTTSPLPPRCPHSSRSSSATSWAMVRFTAEACACA